MSEQGNRLDDVEVTILRILNNHKGRDQAISAPMLAANVGIKKRKLRAIINHLEIEHLIPIASAAGEGGGYYLISSEKEGREFYETFKRRGLTGITRAARVLKKSPLEGAVQLTIDAVMEGDKIPGTGEAVTRLLKVFRSDPERYAKEIAAIKKEVMPLFVSQDLMAEINATARKLQELTAR